ncbi:type IV secretion system DNA-binding domain-containing protein [Riemerella anatipestifer]|uniref:Type IV secretion system DNA-binding domain-containing protein n=1 Tax=Riemerella anatipestifer TaxID=34085 RepID=A0AAP6LM80_RIEAN|nr:type IV secretion system DNA-binding domain-containing protein [Riemerella anatipestifer]MCO7354040.1 type IV secretion system DNA-binding domain-containing protein [Riemerella anatipestifer]MCU7597583.1 type IV secretion system DNA-binding domain-containing protein [Riemerella anatipestifer]MCW0494212.1 type IV secretion system DNA-binding domain-containing protein [Riemerella anatipestifer]MCW0502275.1 type IV secretion system DNA-binding domain-containing protein [Riemerella anatipestifer
MQEQQHQIKLYDFLQRAVYMVVVMDCLVLFFMNAKIPVLSNLLSSFGKMKFFYPPINAKIAVLLLIAIVASGTKAKKKMDLDITKHIIAPIGLGLLLIFSSLFFQEEAAIIDGDIKINLYQILYAVFSFVGVAITQTGADSISKLMQQKMGKDRWNVEEESFDQNKELVNTDTSVNIPYLFRYNRKNHKGWINIDPFRGTLVLGTPGSGKSFGVINPTIRQLVSKGFSLCIYDFKFPDLGQIAYYHYLLKRKKDPTYKHNFVVINLNEVEKSKRVNPLKKEYIKTLADAQEMAESMVSALQKGGSSAGGGADQFFTQSAINFLSSCIYFFATFENGKFSTLPHLLSFMNRSYEEIFTTLFTQEELTSLLSPFKSAYDNKAFDQLEGQVGTLKIFLSRLATKESFWVFSGDEVELKISNKENPSVMILASNPSTQDINSALYSAVLNRILRLINDRGNLPSGVIADEFPTIYIHKIDNVIATARSNEVAVMLGLQELTQLRQFYKKEVAETISSVIGNILSGSARDKGTLEWLEKIFGKIKQKSYSQSISNQGTTTSINEKMESMIPAGKIAGLRTGEMVGMIAQGEENDTEEYKTSAISGKINLDMKEIANEEANYKRLPSYFSFIDKNGKDRKEEVLMTNFRKINAEVDLIVKLNIS